MRPSSPAYQMNEKIEVKTLCIFYEHAFKINAANQGDKPFNILLSMWWQLEY